MAAEKTLAFSIAINGISNENIEMQKLNIQLSNLNKEYKDLQKTIKDNGGLASTTQIQQLAAYSKEINTHKDSIKELNRVMDSAPDSLNRMRAELIRAKDAAAGCSTEIRERMSPYINKMSDDVKKAEAAMGTHTRGVGNYTNAIKSAVSQIFAIAAPAAAAAYALNGLKEAFAGTEAGANLLGRAKLQMTAFFDAIVEGKWRYAFGNELPKDIKVIADLMNKIRIDERKELVAVSEKELEIKNLQIEGIKVRKDSVKYIELLTKAEQVQDELIQVKLNHKGEELNYVNLILKKDSENTAYLDKQAQLQADINNILGERSLRLQSKLETAQEKANLITEIELTDAKVSGIRAIILAEQEQMQQENRQKIMDSTMSGPHYGLTGVLAVKIKTETQASVDGIGNIIDKANAKEISNAEKTAREEFKISGGLYSQQQKLIQGAEGLGAALFQRQFTKMNEQYNAEIKAAGDNAAKKAQIDEVYNKKKSDLARKAALAEKIAGLFSVGIDTAKGIANAASKIITIPLIPWIIANGIIQAGIILAKPIPQFARGGKINRGMSINTGTADDTLIAVNKTETVLTQRHVAMLGGSGAMRNIGVPGYASGGYIGQQAPVMPASGNIELIDAMNARFDRLQVIFDINKLNSAQRELSIIMETQKI